MFHEPVSPFGGKKEEFNAFFVKTKKLALYKGRVTRYTTFGSNKPTAVNEANRSNLRLKFSRNAQE